MAKIGYERVSTDKQHLEAQSDRLVSAGCERVFSDAGQSGRKASRPAWDECLSYLRTGDTLVVVRLDRMGRSVKNLIDVVSGLEARGVDLQVLDQGIDTTTPAGKMMFHVLAALAEFERDIIVERTNDGLEAARARGRVGGRRAKLSDAQATEVVRLYQAREKTVAEIGALFGITRESVYRYVKVNKAS
jgi:DNA invertase Pin-like site-specific DNA recombinase